MSSSEITPPEIVVSEELSSETPSSTYKIWHLKPVVWIGLSVAVIFLLLIFKSFLQKENVVQSKSTVLFPESKSHVSQNIENKKIEKQLILPSAETLPHNLDSKNRDKSTDLSPSATAKESPVLPDISNNLDSSTPHQTMSDQINSTVDTSNSQQVLALENTVKTLEQRLKETENQKIHKSHLWAKFQQLNTALNESRNFEAELQQFSVLFSSQSKIFENLQAFIPYAKEGLPSLDQLLQNFTSVKQEFMNLLEQQETGWHKLILQIMPWIQIYNTQSTGSTSMNLWILLRLEEATMRKDVAQITEIIKPLKQENLPIFNAWRQQIQNYQYLNKIKKDLFNQIISDIVQ
ncbi:MAG: hypothetical protein ACRYGR_03215 [Janthinobacterium lividum]